MKPSEFIKVIGTFAKACPFGAPDFSDTDVAMVWYPHFKEWPRDRLIAILGRLTTAGKFPSIDEIKRAGGDVSSLPVDERKQAVDIANRIWARLSVDGSGNPARAEDKIGPVGWEAVKRLGGWQHLCETTMVDNHGMCIAQWRDLIEVIIKTDGKEFGHEQLGAGSDALRKALDIAKGE